MMRLLPSLLALCLVAGCAVNPVTGRNELNFVSEEQERTIGAQQYGTGLYTHCSESELDVRLFAERTGARPMLALDRLWAHPGDMLRGVRAHRSRTARAASDHLPLVATLEW